MRMRSLILIGVIVMGCGGNGDSDDRDGGNNPGDPDGGAPGGPDGGGPGGPDGGEPFGSFGEELETFIDTLCTMQATCFGADMQACVEDVTTDMADAEAALDEAGEMQCAWCMHVKTREAQAILDAPCDVNAGDETAVFAACDLDPNVDYDGNGTPDDDHDEACAGYP